MCVYPVGRVQVVHRDDLRRHDALEDQLRDAIPHAGGRRSPVGVGRNRRRVFARPPLLTWRMDTGK